MQSLATLARLAESGTPPDSESVLNISVGLDRTIRSFTEETLPYLSNGGAQLQFIFVPYGRGKTHLLRALQEIAKTHGFVTAYLDCHAGNAPFENLTNTYRLIAQKLEPPTNPDSYFLYQGVDAIIEYIIKETQIEDGREKISKLQRNAELACDFRTLAAAYGRVILQNDTNGTLKNDLAALLRAEVSYRVRISDLYKSHQWLPRPIGKISKSNSAQWIRSLSSLPVSFGYPGVIILLDETEQTLSLEKCGPKRRHAYLANLRNFVDHLALGTFRGCAFYYAVVEEFIEVAKTELEALSQRIERLKLDNSLDYPNPRAVWVNLDELTDPSPWEKIFFEKLGEAIIGLGKKEGLSQSVITRLRENMNDLSEECCNSIQTGVVREFVKAAANQVAKEIEHARKAHRIG